MGGGEGVALLGAMNLLHKFFGRWGNGGGRGGGVSPLGALLCRFLCSSAPHFNLYASPTTLCSTPLLCVCLSNLSCFPRPPISAMRMPPSSLCSAPPPPTPTHPPMPAQAASKPGAHSHLSHPAPRGAPPAAACPRAGPPAATATAPGGSPCEPDAPCSGLPPVAARHAATLAAGAAEAAAARGSSSSGGEAVAHHAVQGCPDRGSRGGGCGPRRAPTPPGAAAACARDCGPAAGKRRDCGPGGRGAASYGPTVAARM